MFRKSIFWGPLSFAKQRYEYIKMKGEEMNYSDYMSKGYMFEECRKANIIMQEKYNELYEWYRRNNPDNYDVSDFEKRCFIYNLTKQLKGNIIHTTEVMKVTLAEAIEKAGYSQRGFANILEMPQSNFYKYISNPEKIAKMRLRTAVKMAYILNISLEQLLELSNVEMQVEE